MSYDNVKNVFENVDKITLMTHVVGGYPDLKKSEDIVKAMADAGASIVEIQLPFSDPLADGPIIVDANHRAIKSGIKTIDVLNMIESLAAKINIPLLVMSYVNPLFAYGFEKIVKDAQNSGAAGFIVPDYPPEEDCYGFVNICKKNNMVFVPLISPLTDDKRIEYVCSWAYSPFVYTVLRLGVTGKDTVLDTSTINYLNRVKNISKKYVAAGFGIKSKEQVNMLKNYAHCAVVGSQILREINYALENNVNPAKSVYDFVASLIDD